MSTQKIVAALRVRASEARRRTNERFFKTGPGEYGEGDVFIGVTVPDIRAVVKEYVDASFDVVAQLFAHRVHEVRLAGVLILVAQSARVEKAGDVQAMRDVYEFYLAHLAGVNNWDIVDASAPQVVGRYVLVSGCSRRVLMQLAKSADLWKRRVAIVATLALIRVGEYGDTLAIGDVVIADGDARDLTHKALGWMLREIWKQDAAVCEAFLRTHYAQLPRTTLRYAIERMPERERKRWLSGAVIDETR